MLEFQDVTRSFQLDADTTITPVHSVNLKIEPGEFVVIVGRSGSGKTTLLNLAAGLIKPSAGHVMIDDVDLTVMSDRELSSLRARKMGFIFQFPSLLSALTIKDNVSLPVIFTRGYEPRDVSSRAARLLKALGLGDKLDVYPKQLSAGEQKRVVIARSLINEPQLVLADEPTSELDKRTEKEVLNILRDINSRGVTFLVATHNLDLIKVATRAFEMEDGNLNQVTEATSVLGA